PTARMATVTVTAVVTASVRFSIRTGRPDTRAYSSSWHSANSHGRSSTETASTAAPSTAITTRTSAEGGSGEPNRYDTRLLLLWLLDRFTSTTPPEMPP